MSWDIWKHARLPIELYGTEGSLLNPDPNFFGGERAHLGAQRRLAGAADRRAPIQPAEPQDQCRSDVADYRMVGVLDMACGIAANRAHRASGELALHVLEVMEALERASVEGRQIRDRVYVRAARARPLGMGEEVFAQVGIA